jgi:hypothetical protein
MKAWPVAVAVSLTASCAGRPHRLDDGSYKLDCDATMADCVRKVAQFCHGEGYRIVHGAEENTLVGVPGHQVGHRLARVVFYCSSEAPPLALKLPQRAPAEPSASGTPSIVERTCVPGSTQRCVGPGACEGGQECLKDGSGYGPCECTPSPAGSAADPGE